MVDLGTVVEPELTLDSDVLALEAASKGRVISDEIFQRVALRAKSPYNPATRSLSVKVGQIYAAPDPYLRFVRVQKVQGTSAIVEAWVWHNSGSWEARKESDGRVHDVLVETCRELRWREAWAVRKLEYEGNKPGAKIVEFHLLVTQETRPGNAERGQTPLVGFPVKVTELSQEEYDALQVAGPAKNDVRETPADSPTVGKTHAEGEEVAGEGGKPDGSRKPGRPKKNVEGA